MFEEGKINFNGKYITFIETWYSGNDIRTAVKKTKPTALRLEDVWEVTFYEKMKTTLITDQSTVFDYDYIIIRAKDKAYSVALEYDAFEEFVENIS